jgi:hypothetical protein
LSQPLLQRIVLVGRYLIVIKDDTSSSHLFALARGHGAGTASGAPSTAHRGATTATCRTAAYRDASMAVTTSGAARTTGPGDDHAVRLVTPCTGAMSTSSSVGIIANNAVLTTWFTQRAHSPLLAS